MSIYDSVARYLDEGKKGMVATVVYKAGAAPREEGAKMFVGEDKKSYRHYRWREARGRGN